MPLGVDDVGTFRAQPLRDSRDILSFDENICVDHLHAAVETRDAPSLDQDAAHPIVSFGSHSTRLG